MSAADQCGRCGHDVARHEAGGGGGCLERTDYGFCACYEFVPPEKTTAVMRANLLFRAMPPHHVFSIVTDFEPGGQCPVRGCADGVIARRIMVNIWGSAIEYDVCEACAVKYHGKLMDDMPLKRPDEYEARA